MKISLSDVGSIGNAEIDLSKINVVGGVNSSGKSIISKLLYCHLKSSKDDESMDYLLDSEGMSCFKDSDIVFTGRIKASEVFYFDSISVLDLRDLDILRMDHITHIKEALENENYVNDDSFIMDILDDDCRNLSSAGIKQIAIIDILVKNDSLKRDSFLIIDEPESNLHPDWQIRFAEILVMLVKKMNITIYLNSHSPMFIEAISLYAQYFGLLKKTSFYLTRKASGDNYDFKKISAKNMGEVYENLTRPYDELDRLKAEILFRK